MRPGRTDYLLLILLGSVWGFSFLLIKLAVASIPPVSVAAGRITIGAVVLALILLMRRGAWPRTPGQWRWLAAMGLIGNVIPFALIGWGETHIDSGLAAILMSATPIGAILLAHFFNDEPLTGGKIGGVALGLAGVVILVGPSALRGLGDQLLAQLAVLAATICYAINGTIARRLSGLSGEAMAAATLISAALIALPASLVIDRPWALAPTGLSLFALFLLGLVCTAGGYLLLFALILRAGAGFPAFNNFLVPMFALAWGVLLLGEQPAPQALAALALILAGLAAPRLRPRRPPQPERPRTSTIE